MPDQRCPNCGLWNSGQATLCDCGFDFDTGVIRGANSSPHPPATSSLMKAALYGALGSFLAISPVSIVKTILSWSGLCGHLPPYNPQFPITMSRCGVTLYSLHSAPFWTYLLSTLIGGAFLSTLTVFVFMRVTIAKSPNPTHRRSTPIFWPAFSIGIMFVVIFVFILLYPGQ